MAFSLHDLVATIVGEDQDDWRKRLMKEWPTIVGNLHQRMRLERVMNETAVIGVYEIHWMQELYMISDMIVSTINQKLGGVYVHKIRFVVADKAHERKEKKRAVLAAACRQKSLAAPQKAALTKIQDQKLKEALSQLWSQCQS